MPFGCDCFDGDDTDDGVLAVCCLEGETPGERLGDCLTGEDVDSGKGANALNGR